MAMTTAQMTTASNTALFVVMLETANDDDQQATFEACQAVLASRGIQVEMKGFTGEET
jgi:hypothetical protein